MFGVARYAAQVLNDGSNHLQYAADDVRSFASYARAAWANADSLTLRLATDDGASSASWTEAIDMLHEARLDLFVGYLAGHGIKRDSDHFHFCLHDADIEDGSHQGIISGADIDHAFARVGARTSILFLDCCHAEGIVAGSSYFRSLNGDRARLFLVSARSDQRAWEDDSIGHGLFSNAVTQGLADGSKIAAPDGFVDVEVLFARVSENVAARAFSRKSGARQEPIRGGVTAAPVRLPTASVTALEDQISTYDALTLSLRRWLQRVLLVAVVAAVVTDLSFQHLAVDADGDIVARSGIRLLDPIRRTLPGGIVDTGFDADDIAPRDEVNISDYNALRDGRLLANGLHGLAGWPTELGPLLKPRVRTSLSLLLSGELPASAEMFQSTTDPPPLDELTALISLGASETIDDAARRFGYHVPDESLDCAADISRTLDFPHLNPGTAEFLKELDWRMALAEDRPRALATAGRLVAYRLNVHVREGLFGENPTYDARREFARLAAWGAGSAVSDFDAGGWCKPAALLLTALGNKGNAAAAAERTLVDTVRASDLSTHGDATTPEIVISLFLLAIIAQHHALEDATIDGVAGFFREDGRGLNGPPIFAQWLSTVAPFTTFPDMTREFLIDSLTRPETEFKFRQVTAFEILSRQVLYLNETDRELLLNWRRDNQEEFGMCDSFATGVAFLAPFMPKEQVLSLIQEMRTRTSAAHALVPHTVTWRGDMMISQTDLPEWTAIARMARTVDLSPGAKEELAVYASVAPERALRTAALLAVAHQNDIIRSRDWPAFRRALGHSTAEAWRRDLLVDAAATRLCVESALERHTAFDELRALWKRERTPVIRLALGRTLQVATLCTLAGSADVETRN